MGSILIHIGGVLAAINVVTFFLAGSERGPRSGEALVITVPATIAYIVWLL